MKNLVNSRPIYLSLASALLLTIAWPVNGFVLFLFIGFVPLLLLEKQLSEASHYSALKLWIWVYVTFLLWNLGTTWWVKNASWEGGIMAFTLNALLMSITFMFFHFTKRKVGDKWGYVSFIVYWLGFEYLHHNWDGNYPWLTLGNGFASFYKWVQWYEYTGTAGGSLWVLIVNVMATRLLLEVKDATAKDSEPRLFGLQSRGIRMISYAIALPIIVSLLMYYTYKEKSNPVSIVVVQPNIDPYTEKFSGKMSSAEQAAKTLSLASTLIDDSTEYVVTPETALPFDIWEDQLSQDKDIQTIRAFTKAFSNITYVGGICSAKQYKEGEELPPSARKFKDADSYYDSFNTAMQTDSSGAIQLYHKSKLVPGVECMPFGSIIKHFEKLTLSLGGTTGSLGSQKERVAFTNRNGHKVAPVICYESVYGEFVTEYIHKGAQAIFIITNDAWWGDTPGYHQHLAYGKLRAIETRRSIARSANTGISCFINQRGDSFQETKWWEATAIKGSINFNDKITFYTKFGDYISKIALLLSVVLLTMFVIANRK